MHLPAQYSNRFRHERLLIVVQTNHQPAGMDPGRNLTLNLPVATIGPLDLDETLLTEQATDQDRGRSVATKGADLNNPMQPPKLSTAIE